MFNENLEKALEKILAFIYIWRIKIMKYESF